MVTTRAKNRALRRVASVQLALTHLATALKIVQHAQLDMYLKTHVRKHALDVQQVDTKLTQACLAVWIVPQGEHLWSWLVQCV